MAGYAPTIVTMEVLMMNVAEISAAFQQMASKTPELTFVPHPAKTPVANDFDVQVTTGPTTIQVIEPHCGKPVLSLPNAHHDDSLWRCRAFVEALSLRRAMLTNLTEALFRELPAFPRPDSHIRLLRLAALCDVHVTTVSRAIHGKVCQTPEGLIPYSQFITHLRK